MGVKAIKLGSCSSFIAHTAVSRKVVQLKSIKAHATIPKGMMGCGCSLASSSSRVYSELEGGAMNTCLHVLKETKWILSFKRVYLKFIEYFPDYLSALSRTLLRFFWTTLVETALCHTSIFKS